MATSTVTVPCSCCLPAPYETTITDRATGGSSHSGSVYSKSYAATIMDSTLTPRCTVVGLASNSGIDDWGTIGGVFFDATPNCTNLAIVPLTDVNVVKDGDKLRVDWEAINSPACGAGLAGFVGIRALTFRFYWE